MSVAGHSPIEFLSLTQLSAFFPTISNDWSSLSNNEYSLVCSCYKDDFCSFLTGCLIYILSIFFIYIRCLIYIPYSIQAGVIFSATTGPVMNAIQHLRVPIQVLPHFHWSLWLYILNPPIDRRSENTNRKSQHRKIRTLVSLLSITCHNTRIPRCVINDRNDQQGSPLRWLATRDRAVCTVLFTFF